MVLCAAAHATVVEPQLIEATKGDDLAMVLELLRRGHPSDLGARGWALQVAAANGRIEILLVLIRAGADVDTTDRGNRTALIHAARSGHREVVEALIRAGADLEIAEDDGFKNRGVTALIAAAQKGHAEIVDDLIRAGAKLDRKDSKDKLSDDSSDDGAEVHAAEIRATVVEINQRTPGAKLSIEGRHWPMVGNEVKFWTESLGLRIELKGIWVVSRMDDRFVWVEPKGTADQRDPLGPEDRAVIYSADPSDP